MSNSIYRDTAWAMTKEACELKDIMMLLGMEEDLAIATLERLLPDDVVYNMEDDDQG